MTVPVEAPGMHPHAGIARSGNEACGDEAVRWTLVCGRWWRGWSPSNRETMRLRKHPPTRCATGVVLRQEQFTQTQTVDLSALSPLCDAATT